MKTFYFISAITLIALSIVEFARGDLDASRYAVVCSLLCQILMRMEEKSNG